MYDARSPFCIRNQSTHRQPEVIVLRKIGGDNERYGSPESTLIAILLLVWLARSRVSMHPPVECEMYSAVTKISLKGCSKYLCCVAFRCTRAICAIEETKKMQCKY